MNPRINTQPDVVLIGAGIMSATLGFLLKELNPGIRIEIFERLDKVAAESSDGLNNAGTGHAAFCELNYTPMDESGNIDISKALKIAEYFELSRQLWAYAVHEKIIPNPSSFINTVPHLSFVSGKENVQYLQKRFELLSDHPLFSEMEFSTDKQVLKKWMPLMMQNRDPQEEVAATFMKHGTDVDFGSLTRQLIQYLDNQEGVQVHLQHEVEDLEKENGKWNIAVKNIVSDEETNVLAPFVFIGAGGGSLPLLDKSDIQEGDGFGGFPVSGQWLICQNEKLIEQHAVKVYGKAEVGAPPMSVPHLDTRILDGKKALLFGPYAGFSTRFLKNGSLLDLVSSIQLDNIVPMVSAGIHNIPLTKYLIEQVRQTPEERLEALKKFIPDAKLEDWKLEEAGMRVQVIKKDKEQGGVLQFGTEIVTSADGSISALLGASPGASTSVTIMVELIKRCFPIQFQSEDWQKKLSQMIPSYGKSLNNDPVLCRTLRNWTKEVLEL
jgi:malate dehydrogenase (quinone)